MSLSPFASFQTAPQRTPGVSEIRAAIAAHVRDLIGEDDPEFTDELIGSFRENAAELCDQAEAGYAAGNTRAIASAAHQIKGSASNVGLAHVAHDWHVVEEASRDQTLALGRLVAEAVAAVRHIVAALDG